MSTQSHPSLNVVLFSTRASTTSQETIQLFGAYHDPQTARLRKDFLAASQNPLNTTLSRSHRGSDTQAHRLRHNDGSIMEIWIEGVLLFDAPPTTAASTPTAANQALVLWSAGGADKGESSQAVGGSAQDHDCACLSGLPHGCGKAGLKKV